MAKLDPELATMITDMYQVIHAMNPTTDMTDLGKWLDSRMTTHENNAKQLTQKEIAERSKEFKNLISSMGLATKSTDKLVLEMTKAFQAREQQGTKISKAMQNNAFDEVLRKLYAQYKQTMRTNRTATNPKMPLASFGSSTAKSNQSAQRLQQIIGQNNFGNLLDKATEKIINFFAGSGGSSGFNKTLKNFGADLVDSLGKNKFIGGAFQDSIKLVTLLGASWLRQFGTLGKVLGVALIAAGPFLADAIGKVIGTLLSNALSSIISSTISGQGAMGAIGRAGVSAAGAWALGAWADKEKKDGNVGVSRAARVGSVALGVASGAQLLTPLITALIPALAPILAPIAPIALGVAAVATAIGLLIKYHKQIIQFFKDLLDKLNIPKILTELGQTIANAWHNIWHPKAEGESPAIKGGENRHIFSAAGDSMSSRKVGKLRVNSDGSISNLHMLNQDTAASELYNYRLSNKKQFDNVYEIAHQGIANMADFQNDIVMKDASKGGKVGALLYKGATSDLLGARQILKDKTGLSDDKINQLMFTSGRSSRTSPHYISGAWWQTHANQYALSTDIGAAGWTQEDWVKAYPALQEYYRSLGFEAKFETKVGRATKFGVDPSRVFGTQSHLDIKPLKDVRPSGAVLNQQEVEAAKSSIKVKEPEKKKEVDEDKYDRYKKVEAKLISTVTSPTSSKQEIEEATKQLKEIRSLKSSQDAPGNKAYARDSKVLSDISWMTNHGIIA